MDDEHAEDIESFDWPDLDEVHKTPPSAEDVALWLYRQDIIRIWTKEELHDLFVEYALLYGYQYVTQRKVTNLVSQSDHWRSGNKYRGPKPKKKHYYKVKVPPSVLIRQVA